MLLCRSLIEDSHAGIKISPQDNNFIGLNDRIVTITGSLDERLHAIHLIMSNLIEDAHYSLSAGTPYSYAGAWFCSIFFSSLKYSCTESNFIIHYSLAQVWQQSHLLHHNHSAGSRFFQLHDRYL